MADVRLEHVSKIFPGGVRAVDNVNLHIKDKEFLVLVGPSGCGKSTTLRMIAGLEEISEGNIYIGDRLVNDVPPKDRDIAMVFQNYALYPHMTVEENLEFGLKLRKVPREERKRRVREAAEILDIVHLLDRKPKALSGGQRQRVAVGRAIVRQPKVFLFDEPLSNLDAKLRVQMRTEISKLHMRLQATMIYVTHDQVEAMTMGDRIVVMKDGVVQQVDDPISLYDHPINRFVAGFIGSPPMNFMEGTLVEDNGLVFNEGMIQVRIPEKYYEALKPYAGKRVIFGIRPEDIYDPSYGTELPNKQEVTATVEVIEPMGSEIYLYLTTGKTPFVARVEPHVKAEVEEKRKLYFNMDKAHFFDVETEKSILYREQRELAETTA
ncbi:MAG: sn-glycerol-3-phosphate ABC transporter ATP-binding protein UgpC [Candidatus Sumerlaea chitinivorans]|jgi:multiple sugar transport system ATP-binding protein|uniref:Maltose/maltodextrin ABC transporter, ATP-binding protein MalK n=1 Tax=Sumerlaea chitinivorans TaxID=2250252 RepID=A0A2Z4Y7Q8_SUMC1|nr:Maltose/maltodextrin ABC transporter, ATP-binding protein MalK [Candidatus Sumerlaea chitinivorans]MCX7963544.1 sn-glycerol-3-phosphate ABC transporter ATP-binding protein UgpC [Candidatus Sumerlaea chitinivorans]